ncbi:MAG: transglutaminase-like cysteine peptidase [Halarcobacter sp.]
MQQLFLLIFLSISLLYSKSVTLNNKDLQKIRNSTNEKAITIRLVKYLELKNKVKDFKLMKKLSHVNAFYNKILPINDAIKYNVDDHWATPKEFLINGHGDCEDYAIAKYFTLIETGIPKEKLFLSEVKVRGETNNHMVLLYFENKKAMPLVLDNLSFKVVPFNIRKKLKPKFIFNENDAFILKNKRIYKRVNIYWGKVDKWQILKERVYLKNE